MTTATLPRRTGSPTRAAIVVAVLLLLLIGGIAFVAHLRSTSPTVPAQTSVTVFKGQHPHPGRLTGETRVATAPGGGSAAAQHYYGTRNMDRIPAQPLVPVMRGRVGADF